MVRPVSDWQVNAFRFTAFPSPSSAGKYPNWWDELVGEEPQLIKPGEGLSEGDYRNGVLRIISLPIRIDINYVWKIGAMVLNQTQYPVLGGLESELPIFNKFVYQWLEHPRIPSVNRVAFGATLLLPTADKSEAHSILRRYLPFLPDLSNTSDLGFRINRPRQSTVLDNLKINRLSNWSALLIQQFELPRPGLSATPYRSDPIYSVGLDLDINTDVEHSQDLDPAALKKLWEELIRLGREIVLEGNIP